MEKYAKIINEETKSCIVGLNDAESEFYKSLGMTLQDVEEGYDFNWYVKGYAPQKPNSLIYKEEINELKNQLSSTDYIVVKIAEDEATKEEYSEILESRKSLRARINELESLLNS